MDAQWIASPPAAAALAVTEVPDDAALSAVVALANRTIINAPSKTRGKPASVAYGRLGEGKFVNLVIGRPEGSIKTDRTATIPATRCTPDQRATWEALGGVDWLRSVLDKAGNSKS
ncbi:hypothetical protein ASF44_14695 [Pseudorhodoferax sp. Leaf274]|nr:hypothetical protein ASF44_14695 [Pseudorhodoferax sp. Leaf274]